MISLSFYDEAALLEIYRDLSALMAEHPDQIQIVEVHFDDLTLCILGDDGKVREHLSASSRDGGVPLHP